MTNIKALFKVILKSTLASFSSSKSKALNILLWVIIGLFAIIPLVFVFSFMFKEILMMLHTVNQTGIFVSLILVLITIVIAVFSMLQIPSVYYFSNDTEFFISLPIKPYEIVMSKFLVVILFEYLLVAMIFVPFMVVYTQVTGQLLSIPFAIIVGLLLPVVPVIISSILIILLMNFVPFLRSKNTIMILVGLITIGLSVGFQFLVQSNTASMTPEKMLELVQAGNNTLSNVMFALIPSVRFASEAISNQSIVSLLIFILITVGLVFVYLWLANLLYLNGATSIGDSTKNKNKFKQNQLTSSQNNSVTTTFFKRELKNILRTPAYILNIILPIFIFPILLLILPLMNRSEDLEGLDLSGLNVLLVELTKNPVNLLYFGILAGVVVGLFVGMNNNTLSATSISREAKELVHIKTYPILYKDMLKGKLLVAILFNVFGMAVFLITVNVMFKLPLLLSIVAFVFSIAFTTLTSLFCMTLDIARPNLKWTNETQVIKQGKNVMIASLGSMVMIGVIIALGVVLFDHKLIFILIMLAFLVSGLVALWYNINTNAQDKIIALEV